MTKPKAKTRLNEAQKTYLLDRARDARKQKLDDSYYRRTEQAEEPQDVRDAREVIAKWESETTDLQRAEQQEIENFYKRCKELILFESIDEARKIVAEFETWNWKP